LARYNNGHRNMTALRHHYAREGNSTRRILDAKRIQSTLHYKSKRALPFGIFLSKLQNMFTIFEDGGEGFHGGHKYTTPQRNSRRGPTTGYYSPADWSKLSFKERDQIRKDCDEQGKQGGTKRSMAQVLFATDDTSKLTPNTNS
jgi:hypothetical protein